jgi:hypothetical protein
MGPEVTCAAVKGFRGFWTLVNPQFHGSMGERGDPHWEVLYFRVDQYHQVIWLGLGQLRH